MTPAVIMNNTEENNRSNEQNIEAENNGDNSQDDELETLKMMVRLMNMKMIKEEAHDNENFNGNYVGQNDEHGSDTQTNVNNSIDEESCIFSTAELDTIGEVLSSADVLADEISTNDIVSPTSNK